MKRPWIAAALASLAGIGLCHAQDSVDKARVAAFDNRMFAGPLGQKTYACFVRRYNADHLAQHPKQKVSAMKLLVTSEGCAGRSSITRSAPVSNIATGRCNFDSSGFCNHVVAEKSGNEIRLGCGVDCEGGGIEVAMSKDGKSALIRLERIRIWEHNNADDDASNDLVAGADDKIFRVDRADLRECYLHLRP